MFVGASSAPRRHAACYGSADAAAPATTARPLGGIRRACHGLPQPDAAAPAARDARDHAGRHRAISSAGDARPAAGQRPSSQNARTAGRIYGQANVVSYDLIVGARAGDTMVIWYEVGDQASREQHDLPDQRKRVRRRPDGSRAPERTPERRRTPRSGADLPGTLSFHLRADAMRASLTRSHHAQVHARRPSDAR